MEATHNESEDIYKATVPKILLFIINTDCLTWSVIHYFVYSPNEDRGRGSRFKSHGSLLVDLQYSFQANESVTDQIYSRPMNGSFLLTAF